MLIFKKFESSCLQKKLIKTCNFCNLKNINYSNFLRISTSLFSLFMIASKLNNDFFILRNFFSVSRLMRKKNFFFVFFSSRICFTRKKYHSIRFYLRNIFNKLLNASCAFKIKKLYLLEDGGAGYISEIEFL